MALLHAAFVVFVAVGGLLVLRWPRVAWAHLPAAAWGVAVELGGWTCPLTPLEDALRAAAGRDGLAGAGFVDHWVRALLYPPGLTRPMQWAIGIALLAGTVAVYAIAWRRSSGAGRRAARP